MAVRIARNAAGLVLIALGIVGLFLPFLQGILFLVLGIGLVDLEVKHRAHVWLRRRYRCYRGVALRYARLRRGVRRRRQRRRIKASRSPPRP